MNKTRFTRQELYDLVWSQPIISLSKKYLVSDAGLRKTCKKMNIPLPKSGHWQKIQHGKAIDVELLPTENSGEQEVTLFLREEEDQNSVNLLTPLVVVKQEVENDPQLSSIVPDKLTKPDLLIVSAKKSLTRKRIYGLRDGLAYTDSEELNILVSPDNVIRSLCFMDTLIKCLRKKGHEVFMKDNSSCVKIDDQTINIRLREKQKRVVVPNKYGGTDSVYHPTGILIFQYYEDSWHRTDISEGKSQMKDMVGTIITKLELKAKDMKAYRIELEKGWTEQAERRRVEQEAKDKKEKELLEFKKLFEQAQRWQKTTIIRNYIDNIQAKAITGHGISDELSNWLLWACKKADWYDPLIEAEDNLLIGVNREELKFEARD